MKIVVLCGGLSMERDVSIASGSLVCEALRSKGHKAVLVDMFFGLENIDCAPEALFDELPPIEKKPVPEQAPDLSAVIASRKWKSPSKIGKGVYEICGQADLVFLALHGTCGEDGRIQAMLDLMGKPYTGSGMLASALAMDKGLTKSLVRDAGLDTPGWCVLNYTEKDIPAVVTGAVSLIGSRDIVVKPVDSGSSIGVSITHDDAELTAALEENVALGRVILEQYVSGREIDVAVIDGRALPSIEIIPKHGFYDYANKYQAGATVEICPSEIDPEIEDRLGKAALAAHKALGLSGYSRSDFIVDANGTIWFLEINTLPGMTPTSLVPQEASAVGIDYPTLCEMILRLATEAHK